MENWRSNKALLYNKPSISYRTVGPVETNVFPDLSVGPACLGISATPLEIDTWIINRNNGNVIFQFMEDIYSFWKFKNLQCVMF